MNINKEQYSRICRFLDADMTLAEMEAFEQELIANLHIRQQLDFELSVRDSLAGEETRLFARPAGGHENNGPAPAVPVAQVKRIGRKQWLAVAVAAAVLAVVISIKMVNVRKDKPLPAVVQQTTIPQPVKKDTPVRQTDKHLVQPASQTHDLAALYSKYYKKDELPESYPMYLADAFTGYEKNDYTNLQQLNLTEPSTRGSDGNEIQQLGHYYKGIAFLQTEQVEKAITNLQWVVKNVRDKTLLAKAQWYLALAYLKNKEKDKAVEWLERLVKCRNNYAVKAKKLLNSLK